MSAARLLALTVLLSACGVTEPPSGMRCVRGHDNEVGDFICDRWVPK